MNKFTKKSKILLLALAVVAFGSVTAFAQHYGCYEYVPPTKWDFQKAIHASTYQTWNDLKLVITGRYNQTQENFKEAAKDIANKVRQNPEKYFKTPYALTHAEKSNLPMAQQVAKEIQAQQIRMAYKEAFLQRYNLLQDKISANNNIFYGYALAGQADLVNDISEDTMKDLEALFSGTDSSNTPNFAFYKTDNTVVIQLNKEVWVLVKANVRQILIVKR